MEVFIIRHGNVTLEQTGGGSAFSLISAASVDALPANAAKNTIAVITDQTIGKLYMQPTIPASAASGDLVILTSKSSKTISLSEDGNIEFAIDGAYINIDGVWSFVDTYIRLDDAWALLWSGQLYYADNEYDAYTGGLTSVAKNAVSGSSVSPKAPTINRDDPTMVVSTITNGGGMFHTASAIDLTPYRQIVFEGTFTRAGSAARNLIVGAWPSIPSSYYTSNVLTSTEMSGTSATTLTLDISSVSQSAHIGFGMTAPSGSTTSVKIKKAYLIPNDM